MSLTVQPPKRGRVQMNLSLGWDQAEGISRLAELRFEGNRSKAAAYIIDLHLGKTLERAYQEIEQESAPYAVTNWQKPKLGETLIAYVAGLVRGGNLTKTAYAMAGITPRQALSWTKQGQRDQRDGKESLQADFVAAVEKAEAECEIEDIRRLREHGMTQWKAIAWRLERQHPQKYGETRRIDGTVNHTLTPLIDFDRLNQAQTRQLVELLRLGSPDVDDPAVTRSARPAIELVPPDIIEAADAIEEGEWTEAPQLEAAPTEAPALEAESPGPSATESPSTSASETDGSPS